MRSIRLGRALAAAATLLALAPAGAYAAGSHRAVHRSARGARGCHVSLFAEESLITTGESVQVNGVLSCPGSTTAAVSQTVTILEHTGGTAGFKVIGTATTGQSGVYAIPVVQVTVDSGFYATVDGARSVTKRVKVAPLVTLKGPPESSPIFTGLHHRVTFTGTVTPADDEGAEVVLQREAATGNEEWHVIQRSHVGPGGLFAITHRFIEPGDANLRVLVRPRGKFTFRGVSAPLSYNVSQAENPKLTINSSLDPVAHEQPVTITGVLEKGAGQEVTLVEHPRGNPLFTVVGKTAANGSGEYKFVIASALRNTFYRVTAAGLDSAVLYQGVNYVLTATASKSTASSGEAVTFSGTVSPAREHVIYLERQNAFASGFHVVDVGVVTTGGTYAISRRVVGSGKQVFRVRIPGDPENQATFSSQLPIEVTPATAASLRPVAPSVLPSEGQI
jgi:hypothetical protein